MSQSVYSVSSVVQNQYDLNGNRTNIVYPGGLTVSYEYGGDNRLEGVTTQLSPQGSNWAENTKTISFGYDSASRMTNILYPNGVNSTFGLDAEGQVTNIVHGSFVNRQIIRNELGFKVTELIDAGLKPTAPTTERRIKTHNAADQLVSEQVQSGTNWTNVTYSYSANGCLTNNSETGQNLSYDYNNMLTSVDSVSSVVNYIYDVSGARIGRIAGVSPATVSTNYFVIDYTDGLKRPLAETDASGNVTRFYIWKAALLLCHIEANGDAYYYHQDELGSTLAITDDSGAITDEFAYMPYGYATHVAHSNSVSTPFQWLGGYGVYYDADTDLHLTLHRAYSSKMKRFLQADPLGIDGGANVYAMANMNPLFFVDPYGLCAESGGNWLSDTWGYVRDNIVPDGQYINVSGSAGTGFLSQGGFSLYINNNEGRVGFYTVEGVSAGVKSFSIGASAGNVHNAPTLNDWSDGFLSGELQLSNWKLGIEGAISTEEGMSLVNGNFSKESLTPVWSGAKSYGITAGAAATPVTAAASGTTYRQVPLPSWVESGAWHLYNGASGGIPGLVNLIKGSGE